MIRRLGPADVWSWRGLWVEALTASPDAFLTALDEVTTRSDEAMMRDLDGRHVLGLFVEGQLAATSGLARHERAACAHRARLSGFYVAPARRGTGDADRLLAETEVAARGGGILQLELEVFAGNGRARRFYERNGFAVTGRVPRAVLRNGRFEDDLHMVKALD